MNIRTVELHCASLKPRTFSLNVSEKQKKATKKKKEKLMNVYIHSLNNEMIFSRNEIVKLLQKYIYMYIIL